MNEASAGTLGGRPGRWPDAARSSGRRVLLPPRRESAVVRLAVFAALGAFVANQWIALVAHPPIGRAALAIAATVAGAASLAWIARAPIGRLRAWPLAVLASVLALAGAALAIGVPARLLTPGNWSELGARLSGGLSGIGNYEYPYGGADEWARLAILAGLPLWLGIGAALAFWPRNRGEPAARLPALVVLLTAYVTAVTAHPPGGQVWQGLALLVLVAAWLWLPGLNGRGALTAGALVLAAGVVALPLASRLDGEEPWLDYRHWSWAWASAGGGETFSWDHAYGPLDWPRRGKTLLKVDSDEPHYWRAAMLDEFDGYRWVQSDELPRGRLELPRQASKGGSGPDLTRLDRDWIHRITVTVQALRSELVVGAGTVLSMEGLYGVTPTAAGLALPADNPLENGDAYAIQAYVPNPTVERMAASPPRYPRAMARYTRIELPRGGSLATPLRGEGQASSVPPHVGTEDRVTPSRMLTASPYGRMYELARRLTDRAPTAYDAVNAIQQYLRRRFVYGESPPQHRYPLPAFLFQDRSGYCQQFSGAMALMLRMVGIPSRVAAGFSAGEPTRGSAADYTVRDLDAHSWVEVYFNRIGWVTFDPTPAVAPAESQSSGLGLLRFPATILGDRDLPKATSTDGAAGLDGPAAPGTSQGVPAWEFLAGLGLVGGAALGAAAVAVAVRSARYRSLPPAAAGVARLRELEAAVVRLRAWSAAGTTLLALERRLASVAGPAAAAYAAKLRGARYAPGRPVEPTARERRATRQELTAGLGLRARLRGFLAIPPGGPSRKRSSG